MRRKRSPNTKHLICRFAPQKSELTFNYRWGLASQLGSREPTVEGLIILNIIHFPGPSVRDLLRSYKEVTYRLQRGHELKILVQHPLSTVEHPVRRTRYRPDERMWSNTVRQIDSGAKSAPKRLFFVYRCPPSKDSKGKNQPSILWSRF